MRKLLIHSKSLLAIFLLVLLSYSEHFAQVTVVADRQTASYDAGEFMSFKVTSLQSGTATYEIRHDIYTEPLATGTVELTANEEALVFFQLDEPGSVFCHVTQGGFSNYGGASFAPYDIKPIQREPLDFDAFWEEQKEKLAAVPIDPVLTYHSEHEYSTIFRLNLGNIDGRRIYSYISVPKGIGPFPAFITFPSFGNLAGLVSPETAIPERANAISVSMSVLNVEPDEDDPAGYTPNDITDEDEIFYRYALLGAVRMIDYLFTRDDFDKVNLGVTGVSQGGGLAVMAAGLDQRVKLLMASNPSHGQHGGFQVGKATAFPYYVKLANLMDNAEVVVPQTLDAVRYYDGINFARRFKGNALMLTGYKDDVNPPETVYAIINALPKSKVVVHSRELNHLENPDEYWIGRFDFIRKHFPITRNAPWPFTPETTGYFAEAGDDKEVTNEGDPLSLTGAIFLNETLDTNLPVQWRKVSGPGEVNFSSPTNRTTEVTFSSAGEYVLSFAAHDNETAGAQGRFYTIMDYITVQAGDPLVDVVRPEVNLSTENLEVEEVFEVNILLSEEVQSLTKDNFTITNGTALNLTGSGINYVLTVEPQMDGAVSVQLPENQVNDMAGNVNVASNILTVNYMMPTSLEDVIITNNLKLYPNPVREALNIQYLGTENWQSLRIFNSFGQLVKYISLNKNITTLQVPVGHWSSGIYFLQIEQKEKQINQKFVIKKL